MRQTLIDHKRRVCFFLSPKCASSSLFSWIHLTLMAGEETDRNVVSRINKVYRYRFDTGVDLVRRRGYLAIAFVRHPALRMVSAYVNKLVVGGARKPDYFEALEPFALDTVREILARRGEAFDAERCPGVSLIELLDFCAGKAADPGDGPELNMHWDCQVHDRLVRRGLEFDHVCAVESLAEDFEPVRRLFRAQTGLGERNVTNRREAAAPAEDLTRTPSRSIDPEGIDYRSFLTPEVRERVAALYPADYDYLGYDREQTGRPPAIRSRNRSELKQQRLDKVMAVERHRGWFDRLRRRVLGE